MRCKAVFYVYILFDLAGIPRYVGKGKGTRWLDHEGNTWCSNRFLSSLIRKARDCGRELPKIKICEWMREVDALALEVVLIAAIGRRDLGKGPLANLTDGGDGVSGLKYSEETRQKLAVHLASVRTVESMRKGGILGQARRMEVTTHEQRVEDARKAGKIGGKIGGLIGGPRRMASMSSEERSEFSRLGNRAANGAGARRIAELGLAGCQQRAQCPHCGKVGRLAPLKRWHFDNCPERSRVPIRELETFA